MRGWRTWLDAKLPGSMPQKAIETAGWAKCHRFCCSARHFCTKDFSLNWAPAAPLAAQTLYPQVLTSLAKPPRGESDWWNWVTCWYLSCKEGWGANVSVSRHGKMGLLRLQISQISQGVENVMGIRKTWQTVATALFLHWRAIWQPWLIWHCPSHEATWAFCRDHLASSGFCLYLYSCPCPRHIGLMGLSVIMSIHPTHP